MGPLSIDREVFQTSGRVVQAGYFLLFLGLTRLSRDMRYEDKSRRCDKLLPRTRVASTSFLRPLDPCPRANQMVESLDFTTNSFPSSANAAPWWIVMLVPSNDDVVVVRAKVPYPWVRVVRSDSFSVARASQIRDGRSLSRGGIWWNPTADAQDDRAATSAGSTPD